MKFGIELTDAHCHLDLFDDPRLTIQDARMGGVNIMITAGGSRSSSMAAIKITEHEKNVFAVIGIDPQGAVEDADFVGKIKELVKTHRSVIGIGEIGLDYKVGAEKALQKKVFEEQMEIARLLDVPIVVHSRQAIEDVTALVIKHGVKKAMFHYFEGDEQQAKALADMGYIISIPPSESGKRRRVINALDINSLAAETDSPAVGKNPIDVIRVVQYIAGIKQIPFEEASACTTENVKKLFSI